MPARAARLLDRLVEAAQPFGWDGSVLEVGLLPALGLGSARRSERRAPFRVTAGGPPTPGCCRSGLGTTEPRSSDQACMSTWGRYARMTHAARPATGPGRGTWAELKSLT